MCSYRNDKSTAQVEYYLNRSGRIVKLNRCLSVLISLIYRESVMPLTVVRTIVIAYYTGRRLYPNKCFLKGIICFVYNQARTEASS